MTSSIVVSQILTKCHKSGIFVFMSELEPQPGDAWHPYMIPDEEGLHIPYRYRGEQHQRFDAAEIPAAPTPIGVWEISTKDIADFHNEHDDCTAQIMIDSATVTPRLFISGWKNIDPPTQDVQQ